MNTFNSYDEDDEMDMPTPCEHCHKIFDLNDGYGSEKWHKGITICESCHDEEEKEIELDDEIEELKEAISDAEFTKKESEQRLIEILKKEPWRNIENGINFDESCFKIQTP